MPGMENKDVKAFGYMLFTNQKYPRSLDIFADLELNFLIHKIHYQLIEINSFYCYRKNQKFSLTQKVALAMLATADFMSFCSMSIMAPFYPKAAASRGMSDAMSGFIFGYYALIMFLFSPVFGKIVRKSYAAKI